MSKVQIDILAHADFSGRLRRTKKYPGHAVYATTIENLRRQNPDGTLLLDAGDELSTTFWGALAVSIITTSIFALLFSGAGQIFKIKEINRFNKKLAQKCRGLFFS